MLCWAIWSFVSLWIVSVPIINWSHIMHNIALWRWGFAGSWVLCKYRFASFIEHWTFNGICHFLVMANCANIMLPILPFSLFWCIVVAFLCCSCVMTFSHAMSLLNFSVDFFACCSYVYTLSLATSLHIFSVGFLALCYCFHAFGLELSLYYYCFVIFFILQFCLNFQPSALSSYWACSCSAETSFILLSC